MITLLLFFPYCRDKAALLTSKENHRWTMPTSRDRTRAWASTKAYCKAQWCITYIFCPTNNLTESTNLMCLVLLINFFDWSIGQLIHTLTMFFLIGQKRLATLFWKDNFIPTFFSHSLKLGWGKIIKNQFALIYQ